MRRHLTRGFSESCFAKLALPILVFACSLVVESALAAAAARTSRLTNDLVAAREQITKLNPATPPRRGEPINDLALSQYLETEGRKFVESGCLLTNWGDLLSARSCILKLPNPTGRKFDNAKAAGRIEPSVAVIGTFYLCGKCSKIHMSSASGFFISESGALATCRHVLASYGTNGLGLVALTRDGRLCPVTGVLACDPQEDLIVLQVAGRGFTPLPLAAQDALAGSPVVVVGNPNGHFYAVSVGVVSRQGKQARREGDYRFMSITADFAKGSSGAPVCNESGAVVGVVDNTESIYYSVDHEVQNNLQMVVKNCIPVSALLKIIRKPK